MSNQTLELKLTEVVGELKELTSEIKHLIKGHDETKVEVKELRERVYALEKSLAGEVKLLSIIDRNQVANRRLLYSIAGSIALMVITGGLTFLFKGGA